MVDVMSIAAPFTGFSLSLPPDWFELDVRPWSRDLTIGLLVESKVRDQPDLWSHRTELTKILRRQARDAWDSGARYCAGFIIAVEQSIIPGSLTVSVIPSPSAGASADAVAKTLSTKEAQEDGDTWSRRTIVMLPHAGHAARREGVIDAPLPNERQAVRAIIQQTFVPLNNGSLLLVAASSPALDLAQPLLELFDAVVSTLELSSGVRALAEVPDGGVN
jgi:hypothetical protein